MFSLYCYWTIGNQRSSLMLTLKTDNILGYCLNQWKLNFSDASWYCLFFYQRILSALKRVLDFKWSKNLVFRLSFKFVIVYVHTKRFWNPFKVHCCALHKKLSFFTLYFTFFKRKQPFCIITSLRFGGMYQVGCLLILFINNTPNPVKFLAVFLKWFLVFHFSKIDIPK